MSTAHTKRSGCSVGCSERGIIELQVIRAVNGGITGDLKNGNVTDTGTSHESDSNCWQIRKETGDTAERRGSKAVPVKLIALLRHDTVGFAA